MRLIGRTGSRDDGDGASRLGSAIAFLALVGATGCVQGASVPASSRSPAPHPSPASAAVAPPSQRVAEAAAVALAPTGAPSAVDDDVDDDLDLPSAGGGPTPTLYD